MMTRLWPRLSVMRLAIVREVASAASVLAQAGRFTDDEGVRRHHGLFD